MGNGYYQQFMFSKIHAPVLLCGSVNIGAAGAPTGLTGGGMSSISRLSAGTYRILLEEPYNRFQRLHVNAIAPTTGAPVADGAFVAGTTYQITVVGTTNWAGVGLPSGVVAAVGQSFVATGAGGAGTGTATAVGSSGIVAVEVVGNPQVMVTQKTTPYIVFQTLDEAGAVADPANGSVLEIEMLFRNSSVKSRGE
jgi:hypothetical protein